MHYNDRVTIIHNIITKDSLGSDVKTPVEKIVPCYRGRLTHSQQIGMFGKYRVSAFTIHLLGKYEGIERVIYDGIPRDIQTVYYHRNSTVVVV